jgi:hypothetical protein
LVEAGSNKVKTRVKISWALWGGKRFQAAVTEYESWNERLFAVVQLHILGHTTPLAGNGVLHNKTAWLQKAAKDEIIQMLGLDGELELAEMSSASQLTPKSLEFGRNRISMDQEVGRLWCGTFEGRDVIVDFKNFTPEGCPGVEGYLEERGCL